MTHDNSELDQKILSALMGTEDWQTAEMIARPLASRTVDARTVGGRLRSLKSRGYVESRLGPGGYFMEWRMKGE